MSVFTENIQSDKCLAIQEAKQTEEDIKNKAVAPPPSKEAGGPKGVQVAAQLASLYPADMFTSQTRVEMHLKRCCLTGSRTGSQQAFPLPCERCCGDTSRKAKCTSQ